MLQLQDTREEFKAETCIEVTHSDIGIYALFKGEWVNHLAV